MPKNQRPDGLFGEWDYGWKGTTLNERIQAQNQWDLLEAQEKANELKEQELKEQEENNRLMRQQNREESERRTAIQEREESKRTAIQQEQLDTMKREKALLKKQMLDNMEDVPVTKFDKDLASKVSKNVGCNDTLLLEFINILHKLQYYDVEGSEEEYKDNIEKLQKLDSLKKIQEAKELDGVTRNGKSTLEKLAMYQDITKEVPKKISNNLASAVGSIVFIVVVFICMVIGFVLDASAGVLTIISMVLASVATIITLKIVSNRYEKTHKETIVVKTAEEQEKEDKVNIERRAKESIENMKSIIELQQNNRKLEILNLENELDEFKKAKEDENKLNEVRREFKELREKYYNENMEQLCKLLGKGSIEPATTPKTIGTIEDKEKVGREFDNLFYTYIDSVSSRSKEEYYNLTEENGF